MGKRKGGKKQGEASVFNTTTPSPTSTINNKNKNQESNARSGGNRQQDQTPAKQRLSRITMKDLEELSTGSEGSLPPEEEWDEDAKKLKSAILSGEFDHLLDQRQHQQGDDESIEEVELADDDTDDKSDDDDQDDKEENDDLVSEERQEGHEDDESNSDSYDNEEDDSASGGDDAIDDKQENENRKRKKRLTEEKRENVDDDEENDGEDESATATNRDHTLEVEDVEPDESDDKGSDDLQDIKPIKSEKEKKIAIDAQNQTNAKALNVVTDELAAEKKGWSWSETFTITPATPLPFGSIAEDGTKVDIHDDLKREVTFYEIALEAARAGRLECKKANIPFSRPDDFFVEMVKTDEHMAKVKDRLIFESKKIEAVAMRKANKEHQLRAKESHSNRLAEKAKRKKQHFKALAEWNNASKSNGGQMMDDSRLLKSLSGGGDEGRKGPNKKRQYYDQKYGHGGKRGRFKQNDPKSMNDMSAYNPRGNFSGGMKKVSGASNSKRKGKRARDSSRSRGKSSKN